MQPGGHSLFHPVPRRGRRVTPSRPHGRLWLLGSPDIDVRAAMVSVCDNLPGRAALVLTDHEQAGACTRVVVDVGHCTLANGVRTQLLTAREPGRRGLIGDLMLRGHLGVILLIDNAAPGPLAELERLLSLCAESPASSPCVIGVVRSDAPGTPGLDAYEGWLVSRQPRALVLAVNPRRHGEMRMLVEICHTALALAGVGAANTVAGLDVAADPPGPAVEVAAALIRSARERAEGPQR